MTPTVLLAPDKFKGTLTAAQVVDSLRRGITQTAPQLRVLSCPIADGGDGTIDAALAAGFTHCTATVTGPTGEPRAARWAQRQDVAVLELAETVGLQALPGEELAPHTSSTRGLGELMAAAVASGARTLLVGLGGSASTDAGAGLLQGLGAHLRTADGADIGPGLAGLDSVATMDLGPAFEVLDGVTLIAANDVTNPLLGAAGAVAVYGPQKGIAPAQIDAAEAALAAAARVMDPTGTSSELLGAGAAGGTGFGLFLLGAVQRSGLMRCSSWWGSMLCSPRPMSW
nr:glycerate kinase [Brachybacterium avium]